jgi:hypothetical protein
MKKHWKTLIAAIALAGGTSTIAAADGYEPAGKGFAPPQGLLLSSVVDLWIGYVWMDSNVDSGDAPPDTGRAGGQVLFNIPLGNQFSAQLDFAGEGDFDNANGGAGHFDYVGLIQGGGHLSYRDPKSFLLGAFAGIGEAYVTGDDNEGGWMVGGEGQAYLGNTTLYGQAGYFDSDANDSETLVDAWFVRGVVRHFLTSNSMISAEFLYGWGENTETTPDDIDFAGWEVLYKQQMESNRVAWFAGYEGHYMSNDPKPTGATEDLYEHIIKVGVSFKFHGNDLLTEDRYGATLDLPLDPLRTAGYTADIVD